VPPLLLEALPTELLAGRFDPLVLPAEPMPDEVVDMPAEAPAEAPLD
jgi:hypothetical protein